jgi:hypothetical protein
VPATDAPAPVVEQHPAPESAAKPAFAALPALAFNPDDGLGLGIFGDLKWPARPGEPRRYRALYSWNAKVWIKPGQPGWEVTTGIALPSADGRVEVAAGLLTFGRLWDLWFGLGQDRVRDLRPHEGAPDAVREGWNRWRFYRVRWDARAFFTLGGGLRAVVGTSGSWNHVDPLGRTLLGQWLAAGRVPGEAGGVTLSADLGLQLDRRDDPVDPVRGAYALLLAQGNTGPDGYWGRLLGDVRLWWGPQQGQVVLCGRFMAQAAGGEVPFYEHGVFASVLPAEPTVTGPFGTRGLDRGRLRGPLTLVGMAEVRFRPPAVRVFSWLHLRLVPAAWIDVARVDTIPLQSGGLALQPAFGGALRLVWNGLTVTRLDIGSAPESVLDDSGVHTRWTFAVYGTVNHPF